MISTAKCFDTPEKAERYFVHVWEDGTWGGYCANRRRAENENCFQSVDEFPKEIQEDVKKFISETIEEFATGKRRPMKL